MLRRLRWLAVFTVLGMLVPVLPVGVAMADAAVVSGACGETEFDAALALAQTNGGGTITFDCGGPTTITFSGQKAIVAPNAVVIDGAGLITLSGNNATRHFTVESGASLELRGLNLIDGYAAGTTVYGGSIDSTGTLTILDTTFRNNKVDASVTTSANGSSGIARGGAIHHSGAESLTIRRSSFIGNVADVSVTITGAGSGALGIAMGGALYIIGTSSSTIEDSTFSENTARALGSSVPGSSTVGGISQGGAIVMANVTLAISNSTISGNRSEAGGSENHVGGIAEGGGIFKLGASMPILASTIAFNESDVQSGSGGLSIGGGIRNLSGGVDIEQSIVTNNLPSDCELVTTSNGHNLDSDGSCSWSQPTDISSGNADLAPLADNGGPTMTHMLLANSDALDSGPATCIPTDQRGEPRPAGAACDIGAVEVQSVSAFPLCVDYYTGRVISPLRGECGARQMELLIPDSYPLAFCIDPYTGGVTYRFGRPCNPPRQTHVVPDNGDLLTCVSLYTGANRRVFNHSQCKSNEVPNSISAA